MDQASEGDRGTQSAVEESTVEQNKAGADGPIVFGTCSWTDPSLFACAKFYPPGSRKSPEDLLAYYATQLPCVEVDMTTYSIPQPHRCAQWAKVTPKDFVIHIKAFCMFTQRSADLASLPYSIRAELCAKNPKFSAVILEDGQEFRAQSRVSLYDLGDLLPQLWRSFNEAILPIYEAGKLGLVLFQFMESFRCTPSNIDYVMQCRSNLDSRFQFAAEFRSDTWTSLSSAPAYITKKIDEAVKTYHIQTRTGDATLSNPPSMQKESSLGGGFIRASELQKKRVPTYAAETVRWLREIGVVLVTVDEMRMTDAGDLVKLPIFLDCTHPETSYIRVHRRIGHERLLPEAELQAWAEMIPKYLETNHHTKKLYFLWNTNYEDQSMVNIARFSAFIQNLTCKYRPLNASSPSSTPLVQRPLIYNWKAVLMAEKSSKKGTIFHFLSSPKKPRDTEVVAPDPLKQTPVENDQLQQPQLQPSEFTSEDETTLDKQQKGSVAKKTIVSLLQQAQTHTTKAQGIPLGGSMAMEQFVHVAHKSPKKKPKLEPGQRPLAFVITPSFS